MLTVELAADDLENNGQLVKIGRVARAIAKSKGVTNLLNSERKIFRRINAGVQTGALNPIDPETLEPLSKSDYGNGLVHFDELAEWGRTQQFDFRVSAPAKQSQMEDVQTIASDESTCDTAERVRNGEPIQWDGYWLSRQAITPQQAAKLAHCIDPIKWPADETKHGPISNALRIKIQRCTEQLAERNQTWTLVELAEALGKENAPHGMKQAVWIESARLARGKLTEEMRKLGRYTLEIAANEIDQRTGDRAGPMLEKLMQAVRDDSLPVYEPGQQGRYQSKTVRAFYEEAYWCDLNDWLAENEPRIDFRFPKPPLQIQDDDSQKIAIREPVTGNRTPARIEAIVETARQLDYDPMAVPYGGKAAIRRECLEKRNGEPCRFTPDTFKTAWQAARNAGRIDVQDADIYRGH